MMGGNTINLCTILSYPFLTLLDPGGGVDSITFSEFAKFSLIPLNKQNMLLNVLTQMFVLKRLKEGVHCTKSIKAQGPYTYDASPDPSKTGHFVLCKYFENQRWMDEFMYGHNLDPSDLFDK